MMLAATFLLLWQPHARAEVVMTGTPEAVRLEANQASLREILAALENSYGVRYRASIDLDRPITGTFSGSLARVIAHLLDGYDYVVKVSSGSVEITLLQSRGTEPVRVATGDAAPRRRTSISRLRP